MANLIIPSRRLRQPQGAVRIDAQYAPYAKCAIVGGIPVDLARNVLLPVGLTTSVNGNGRAFVATPRYVLTADSDSVLPIGGSVTVLFQTKHVDVLSSPGTFGNNVFGGSGECNAYIPYSGDGKVYWRWGGETEGSSSLSVPSLSFDINDWWALTAGPRGMEVWKNGIRVGSNSATPSRASSSGTSFYLAQASSGAGEGQETFSFFSVLSTQLPENFLAQRQYWGLFAPDRRVLYFDVPATKSTSKDIGGLIHLNKTIGGL